MIKQIAIGFVVLTFIVISVTILFQYQMGGVALQAKLQELKGAWCSLCGGFWLLGFFNEMVRRQTKMGFESVISCAK